MAIPVPKPIKAVASSLAAIQATPKLHKHRHVCHNAHRVIYLPYISMNVWEYIANHGLLNFHALTGSSLLAVVVAGFVIGPPKPEHPPSQAEMMLDEAVD